MAGGTPMAERPPKGLSAHWLGVWRGALKVMKQQGTWSWEQKPLLDEYVYALRAADDCRQGFDWLDGMLERDWEKFEDLRVLERIAVGLPVRWDQHAKRAAALADQLVLTPRGRKAAGIGQDDEDEPPAPSAIDQLAARRAANA